MFPHIIERNGRFLVRRFSIVGFQYMVAKPHATYWWIMFPEDWSRFETAHAAQVAYLNRAPKPKSAKDRKKFIRFL